MSPIQIKTASPDFEPGTYEMVLIAIAGKNVMSTMGRTAGTEQPMLEWTWGDPDDDTLDITMLSSYIISPKSRLNECLVALLGPEAVSKIEESGNFEPTELIGKKALLTIGLSDKGYSKVMQVTALPTRRTVRQTVAPAPVAVATEPVEADALPF